MSGVAVTFLLIAAIFMVQAIAARMKEREAENVAKVRLAQIQSQDLAARLFLEHLLTDFTSDPDLRSVVEPTYDPAVDPYALVLTLNRHRFLFQSEECDLAPPMLEATRGPLRGAIATLCRAPGAMDHLLAITLEGHTDAKPFFPRLEHCGAHLSGCADVRSTDCEAIGFENNVRLSGSRAQNLFFELRRSVAADSDLATCLDRFFTVSGRGPVEAKGTDEGSRLADRRVVFKVRVRAGGSLLAGDPQ
jgi:hypothetical protein